MTARSNKNAGGTPRMKHGRNRRSRRKGPYALKLRGQREIYDRPALNNHKGGNADASMH